MEMIRWCRRHRLARPPQEEQCPRCLEENSLNLQLRLFLADEAREFALKEVQKQEDPKPASSWWVGFLWWW